MAAGEPVATNRRHGGSVDEVDPAEAWELLAALPASVLVDVRTRAEWSFVGVPELGAIGRPLWLVEWVTFPEMTPNPGFFGELTRLMGERPPERLFFICRSGARSLVAARRAAEVFGERGVMLQCTNVAEGFEGDLDERGHRGTRSGWKARGLPWRQN